MPTADRRFNKTRNVIRSIPNPSVMEKLYASRVYRTEVNFLGYADMIFRIFIEKHPEFKLKEFLFLCWLHKQPIFTTTQIREYPHGYGDTRVAQLKKKIEKRDWIEIVKNNGNGQPRQYKVSKHFKWTMTKYYNWLLCFKPIPLNRNELGDLFDDPYIKQLIIHQHTEVQNEKDSKLKVHETQQW